MEVRRKRKLIKEIKEFLFKNYSIDSKEYEKETYHFIVNNQESYNKLKNIMDGRLYVKKPV